MNFTAAQRLADELKRDIPDCTIEMIANGVGLLRDLGFQDIPDWAANCPQACWFVRVKPSEEDLTPFWAWYDGYCDDMLMEIIAKASEKQGPENVYLPESTWLDESVPSYRYYSKGGEA